MSMLIDDIRVKARWLYGDDSARKMLRAALSDAGLCMLLYRAMYWCDKYAVTRVFAMILCKVNAVLCGAVIGKGAKFGRGFVILHSVGVVINTRVQGGEKIYLESGVVIGETKRGCPIMGNNIFVGAGAKIVGDIRIGDNVTIGANAVVVKSVPDNVVVGGIPAKVIRIKEASERYLVG